MTADGLWFRLRAIMDASEQIGTIMKSQTSHLKAIGTAVLAVLIVAVVGIAMLAYGSVNATTASADMETATNELSPEEQEAFIELARTADADAQAAEQEAEATDPAISAALDAAVEPDAQPDQVGPAAASDCTVTLNYLEYADYEDPDASFDDMGRRILGTRVLTGFHEGDVLNIWDYVVDIPGHFFFDGWPLNLTVTADPAQNHFDLIYVKLYNSEYTVNYYLMTGADLQADNWTDALAPEGVEFTKMGSETFKDQRFDELVKGDAYEYMLNGMYVIDTYPAEIRLGTDPDNNTINVLYTPDSANLPDDVEVPSDTAPAPPSNGVLPPDTNDVPLPGNPSIPDDFIGSDVDRGEMNVTDEMLSSPVSEEDAERLIGAYNTGLRNGTLAQTGDNAMAWVWALVGVAAAAVVALVVVAVVRRKKAGEQA